jgi:hypothetical protein
MLNGITTNSKYIHITETPMPYIGNNGAMAGAMRYSNGNVEVYDGSIWRMVGCMTTVSLSNHADSLLDWVAQKKSEEEKLTAMLEKYPSLKSAKDQYEIVKALCESDHELEAKV